MSKKSEQIIFPIESLLGKQLFRRLIWGFLLRLISKLSGASRRLYKYSLCIIKWAIFKLISLFYQVQSWVLARIAIDLNVLINFSRCNPSLHYISSYIRHKPICIPHSSYRVFNVAELGLDGSIPIRICGFSGSFPITKWVFS